MKIHLAVQAIRHISGIKPGAYAPHRCASLHIITREQFDSAKD
jgi:hypothetical protein